MPWGNSARFSLPLGKAGTGRVKGRGMVKGEKIEDGGEDRIRGGGVGDRRRGREVGGG